MKKVKFLIVVLIFCTIKIHGQVSGLSYTFSPSVEYQNWDTKLGISNGLLVGGQVGFGFGQYLELRANYMQTLNTTRDFSALVNVPFNQRYLDSLNVDLNRWGGELKMNLSNKAVVPFLTVGTGIQRASLDTLKDIKNVYFNLGGGIQFSINDRYTLSVEAKNNYINSSPIRSFTTSSEKEIYEINNSDYPNSQLQNWSYRASLIFYLGGNKPSSLTDTDKAYLETFSSGFSSISFPIEIATGQVNFSKDLGLGDRKFTGVSSGFNFGPYVGIRGFYWRSNTDGYFSKIDRLAIYGGEGKFKLGAGQGLNPYLTVGGGKIDALSNFELVNDEDFKDSPFVSGGFGIDLPFSKFIKLSAFAKAMVTSNSILETAENANDLSTSMAYGLQLNLAIGKSKRKVEETLTTSYDDLVNAALVEERAKTAEVIMGYQKRIERLESQISERDLKNNTAKNAGFSKSEKEAERSQMELKVEKLSRLLELEKGTPDALRPTDLSGITELIKTENKENMERVKELLGLESQRNTLFYEQLKSLLESTKSEVLKMSNSNEDDLDNIESNINELDRKLNRIESVKGTSNGEPASSKAVGQVLNNASQENSEILASESFYLSETQRAFLEKDTSQIGFFSNLNYTGSSAFGGINIGGNPTANLGLRWHYKIGNSSFYAMPETFFGFGNPSSFGLFLNMVKEINIKGAKNFSPYIGLGGGFLKIGEKGTDVIKLTSNVVIGAHLFKVAGGKFYVDLSGRSFFKHNQFVAGYRLPF
ncbi:MAG: hypothetical protein ACI9IP_001624 [Arcticibacterium sp.]|jgi:hypothetical protein